MKTQPQTPNTPRRPGFPARLVARAEAQLPQIATSKKVQAKFGAWLLLGLFILCAVLLHSAGLWLDGRSLAAEEQESATATAEAVAWMEGLMEGRRQAEQQVQEDLRHAYMLGQQHTHELYQAHPPAPPARAASSCGALL